MAKSKEKAQAIQWPSQKKKYRQYNGQVKRKSTGNTMAKSKEKAQAIQWPSQKKKDRQYNGQVKRKSTNVQTMTQNIKHYIEN